MRNLQLRALDGTAEWMSPAKDIEATIVGGKTPSDELLRQNGAETAAVELVLPRMEEHLLRHRPFEDAVSGLVGEAIADHHLHCGEGRA